MFVVVYVLFLACVMSVYVFFCVMCYVFIITAFVRFVSIVPFLSVGINCLCVFCLLVRGARADSLLQRAAEAYAHSPRPAART